MLFSKRDWFNLRPLLQPYMYNHSTPIWEGALLITLVGTSIEPALLVAGVTRSLSIRGRAWKGDHVLSLQAPGTPLCSFMDGTM